MTEEPDLDGVTEEVTRFACNGCFREFDLVEVPPTPTCPQPDCGSTDVASFATQTRGVEAE